jgi:hypothetical protein
MSEVLDVVVGRPERQRRTSRGRRYHSDTTMEFAKVTHGNNTSKIVDVCFTRSARAMLIDVACNLKSMCGITAFLSRVTSARDVTTQKKRRTLVIANANLLSPVCQNALRSAIEKAITTTWIVLSTRSLGSLEPALVSRFVCVNINPVRILFSPNAYTCSNDTVSIDTKPSHPPREDAFVERLVTKLIKMRSCTQLRTISVSRAELMRPPPSHSKSKHNGGGYDILTDEASAAVGLIRLGRFFFRLINYVSQNLLIDCEPDKDSDKDANSDSGPQPRHISLSKSGENGRKKDFPTSNAPKNRKKKISAKESLSRTHVHPGSMQELVRRLAEIEQSHILSENMLSSSSILTDDNTPDTASAGDIATMTNRVNTFVVCACVEVKLATCGCVNSGSNEENVA